MSATTSSFRYFHFIINVKRFLFDYLNVSISICRGSLRRGLRAGEALVPGPGWRRAQGLFFRGGVDVRPCAQDQLAPGGSRGIPNMHGEGGGPLFFFLKKRLKSVEEDEVQHCPIIARLVLIDFLNRILVLIYRNKFWYSLFAHTLRVGRDRGRLDRHLSSPRVVALLAWPPGPQGQEVLLGGGGAKGRRGWSSLRRPQGRERIQVGRRGVLLFRWAKGGAMRIQAVICLKMAHLAQKFHEKKKPILSFVLAKNKCPQSIFFPAKKYILKQFINGKESKRKVVGFRLLNFEHENQGTILFWQ